MTKLFKNTWKEMGFFDVWSDLHPLQRDYSHYLVTHSVFSQIDFFFFYPEGEKG